SWELVTKQQCRNAAGRLVERQQKTDRVRSEVFSRGDRLLTRLHKNVSAGNILDSRCTARKIIPDKIRSRGKIFERQAG
ncbi:MAG: hypothetical protein ACKVII_23020, partial [Planctomycetales bacterium]